jgi:hypothetical protein
MIFDFTAELAPFLWGMIGLLLMLAGAILASIDPETAEIYLGDRRMLAAVAALVVVTVVALIAAHDIATGLGLPVRGAR